MGIAFRRALKQISIVNVGVEVQVIIMAASFSGGYFYGSSLAKRAVKFFFQALLL